MIQVFFSYSHKDEAMRDELETHLAMLKRQGLVEAWHDRRIAAGTELDSVISENLEKSDVILLLVSPDFLASDYCYEVEASRALERHRSGDAVVIPVILEPCDWHNSPLGKLRATPTDGKPIAKYPNRNDAYLEVVGDIREAAQRLGKANVDSPVSSLASPKAIVDARSSNLRVKKVFNDRDRDKFIDEAFSYIRNFFAASLDELKVRNAGIEHRLRDEGNSAFSAAIYIGGEKRSSCRIWLGGRNSFGEIAYSASDSGALSGINESMRVEDDGYQLGLTPMGLAMIGSAAGKLLTHQGAAEYFWAMLVSRLQ
jgi:hypothetical protein